MELRKTYHIRRVGLDARATVVRDAAGRVRVESARGSSFEDLRILDGGRSVSIRQEGRMFLVDIARLGPRLRAAFLNGQREHVEVLDELAAAAGGARRTHEGRSELRAEMPGLVVTIKVQPGQRVAAGEPLIVLEAMKMQNELAAPRAGVVGEVLVKPGQKVEGGTVLLRLADPADLPPPSADELATVTLRPPRTSEPQAAVTGPARPRPTDGPAAPPRRPRGAGGAGGAS
jgi:biotin carboxyl carrier protein